MLPFFGALLYFVVCAGHPAAPAIYAGCKVVMVAWALVVWWRWGVPRPTPTTTARWRALGEGLGLGLVSAAAILAIVAGPLAGLMAAATPRIAAKVQEFGIGEHFLLASAALSLLHSAFEEWYWRWFAYGQLQARLPQLAAHALAGLAFALHHCVIAGVYAGWPAGILLGLVVGAAGMSWSWLYQRHGSLLGAWCAHACCDAALMYVGYHALAAGSRTTA